MTNTCQTYSVRRPFLRSGLKQRAGRTQQDRGSG